MSAIMPIAHAIFFVIFLIYSIQTLDTNLDLHNVLPIQQPSGNKQSMISPLVMPKP